MGFKRVEKNRRSPDAISPEGTAQSVARHGSAGKDFKQIESRRDNTMGSLILPPQNVSLSKAVLMRKGGEDNGKSMKFREPTELHRKSGVWGTRRFVGG